jgi:hypothetical protein
MELFRNRPLVSILSSDLSEGFRSGRGDYMLTVKSLYLSQMVFLAIAIHVTGTIEPIAF